MTKKQPQRAPTDWWEKAVAKIRADLPANLERQRRLQLSGHRSMEKALALAAIFEESRREGWCTRWGCSTCGADHLGQSLADVAGQVAEEHSISPSEEPRSRHPDGRFLKSLTREAMQFSPAGARALADALRQISALEFQDQTVFALRLIADHIDASNIQSSLRDSEAGDIFERMIAAKDLTDRRRDEHRRRNDPEFVKAERNRKAADRAKRHQERLAAKRLRQFKQDGEAGVIFPPDTEKS